MSYKHAWMVSFLVICLVVVGGVAGHTPTSGDADTSDTGQIQAQTEANEAIVLNRPNVSVLVSGTTVSDGESITTGDNPELTVQAVSPETIELLTVSIDGQEIQKYRPNTSSFTESLILEVDAGEHDLKIEAITNQSNATHRATIVEDSTRPRMTFHSPFSTDGRYDSPEASYTLNETKVVLNGTIHDLSNVTQVVIEKRYSFDGPGGREDNRDMYVIEDPGDSIVRPLELGPSETGFGSGKNILKITLTDKFGQVRTYQTEVAVKDTDGPNITAENVIDTANDQIRVQVSVTDKVGLKSLGTRSGSSFDSTLEYIIMSQPADSRPTERTFTRTVPISESPTAFTVVASDETHTTTRKISVNYEDIISPQIELAESPEIDENSEIRVQGRVTEGRITRVSIESVDTLGEVIDSQQIYDGDVTDSVEINETLRVDGYYSDVNVRAVDSDGNELVRTIELSQPDDPTNETDNTTSESENQDDDTGTSAAFIIIIIALVSLVTVIVAVLLSIFW